MEIIIKKKELIEKLKIQLNKNFLDQCAQAGANEEETKAHVVLNKKRIDQDAETVTRLIFDAYGVIEEDDPEESEELV